jgi:hypothetical protein
MVEHRSLAPSPPWAGRDGEGRSGGQGWRRASEGRQSTSPRPRSPNEDLRHSIGEFFKVDGLPHARRTLQHGRVSLMTAVAGDQNKGHFVAQEQIGHRRPVLSIQVGVQQRPIETVLAYGRDSPFEGSTGPTISQRRSWLAGARHGRQFQLFSGRLSWG